MAGTELLLDTFTRADTAPAATPGSVGNNWVDKLGNAWSITGGRLQQHTSQYQDAYLLQEALGNFDKGKISGELDGTAGMLLVKAKDDPRAYILNVYSNGYQLSRMSGGTIVILEEVTLSRAEPHRFEYSFWSPDASTTRFFAQVFRVSDNALVSTAQAEDTFASYQAAGPFGLSSIDPTNAFWDNVRIEDTPADEIVREDLERGVVEPDAINMSITATSDLPLTYQWQRKTEHTGDWGDIAGATSATVRDTAVTPGVVYNYRCNLANGVRTSTSRELAALTSDGIYTLAGPGITAPLKVAGIGDSLTNRANPFTELHALLSSLGTSGGVDIINLGQENSRASYWLLGASQGYFAAAVTAMNTQGTQIASIMLGTNDAYDYGAATYVSHLKTIIDGLFDQVGTLQTVVVQPPPYSRTNFPAGSGVIPKDDDVGQAVVDFKAELQTFNFNRGTSVIIGNDGLFNRLAANPTLLEDGTHLTDDGETVMQRFWADGILAAMRSADSITNTTTGDSEVMHTITGTLTAASAGNDLAVSLNAGTVGEHLHDLALVLTSGDHQGWGSVITKATGSTITTKRRAFGANGDTFSIVQTSSSLYRSRVDPING